MKQTSSTEGSSLMLQSVRAYTDKDYRKFIPVLVVWEITLACNLKCLHCGSRAGRARPNELSTEECLEVVEQLARLGTREVALIGGEAYLRRDWTEIIRAIHTHGMYCSMQTGARNLTERRITKAIEAGLQGIGVSIDGLAPLHDKLRGVPKSFEMAIDALKRAKAAGLGTSVNTQISSQTINQLPELMDQIIKVGASQWQIQLTVAMGNAVDNDDLLLQPYQLHNLMPLLARLYREGLQQGLLMTVGNNIGYFGPYEHLWRGYGDERIHWSECSAGQTVMGLEADGTVKGCPSLPTVSYAGGNIRDLTLEEIWKTSEEIHFGRLRSVDDLWGFCGTCYYADVCRGGCTWTAHSLFGKPGNNPYCHYRVLELQKQGVRERIVKIRDAMPASFAIGEFELITEPIPGHEANAATDVAPSSEVKLPYCAPTRGSTAEGWVPSKLDLCRACKCYIWPHEETCPHCGADIKEAAAAYTAELQRQEAIMNEVRKSIEIAKARRATTSTPYTASAVTR